MNRSDYRRSSNMRRATVASYFRVFEAELHSPATLDAVFY